MRGVGVMGVGGCEGSGCEGSECERGCKWGRGTRRVGLRGGRVRMNESCEIYTYV